MLLWGVLGEVLFGGRVGICFCVAFGVECSFSGAWKRRAILPPARFLGRATSESAPGENMGKGCVARKTFSWNVLLG